MGNLEDLKILAHSDASHLTSDEKTRGIKGRIIFLANDKGTKVSPLSWTGKVIPTVCKSAKAAETRALDSCSDQAIDLARIMGELFTGKHGFHQVPVDIKIDNMGLLDSIQSTKQVEERLL